MFWIIISWLAVILTATQFIPQAIKAIISKKLRDISLTTYIMAVFTSATWIMHGLHNQDNTIVTANILVLITALIIVILKVIHRKEGSAAPQSMDSA